MGLLGRYFSDRDRNLVGQINAELMGDIVQNVVLLYKLVIENVTTNIYGEVSQETGKIYYPGVEMTAFIERADENTEGDNFGPDRSQDLVFRFREKMLQTVNFFPEIGDIILFNERYYEINNTIQNQFLAGVPEKSHSIICNGHYTRLSKINIYNRTSENL
jgi:hypothetical protein